MTTHVFNVDGTGEAAAPEGLFAKVVFYMDKYKRWCLLATAGLAFAGGLQMLIAASSVPTCCSQKDTTADIMIALFAITTFVEAVRFLIGVFAHPLTPSHMGICELLGSVTSLVMAIIVVWYSIIPSPFMKTFDYAIVVIITSFFESIQLYHKYFTNQPIEKFYEEFPFLQHRPSLTVTVFCWFYLRMLVVTMAMIAGATTYATIPDNTFIYETGYSAWRHPSLSSKELPMDYYLRTGNSSANYVYSYYNITYDVRKLWDGSTVSQNCTIVQSMQDWEDQYNAANGSDDGEASFMWNEFLCQWETKSG